MTTSSKTGTIIAWILGVILAIIALGVLARYTFLREQFDKLETGLNNIAKWEQDYKATHPNATKAEIDAAFKSGIADMENWKQDYKAQHPGATDAEADAALEAGLKNLDEHKQD